TGSSSNCSSRPDQAALPDSSDQPERRLAVIACGALGGHVRAIAARRGLDIQVRTLPSMLHNSPRQIAPLTEQLAGELQRAGFTVAVAYADCGTYGALDEVCERRGLRRLPGLHCYDVYAGPERIEAALAAEPGTYLLTDFLVRSFRFSVIEPLGLDRYPELWPDYFGHYRRVVWLAQEPDPGLAAEAGRIAGLFGLPLTRIDTGLQRLEQGVLDLLFDLCGSAS
ncbi:MAG TPA: DUF1638 domain-containing protein, partial [Streptosporangiaceae bacterium]